MNEEYYKTELFCPSCGKQEVWDERGQGDYYQGTTLFCLACNSFFNLPNWVVKILPLDTYHKEKLKIIRSLEKTQN